MRDPERFSADRELITSLTAAALDRAAPEELLVLDETAEEYFANPKALLSPKDRDEAVGFGIEIGLIAPYVLAVATAVVGFLLDTVSGAAQDAAKPLVVRTAKRLIRGTKPDPGEAKVVPLSADQIRYARQIAYDQARRLGLAEGQCVLLADSVAGGLVSAP
jgi:hypothetical protein